MKVITSSEIIYSNAFGKRKKDKGTSDEKPKKEKTGFFSKEKKEERKENRGERQKDRSVRRAERRAKRGARPLKTYTKNGKQWFKDHLPKVRKKSGGGYEKVNKDGTVTPVADKDVVKIPPPPDSPKGTEEILIDKTETNGKKMVAEFVAGIPEVVVDYAQNEVTAVDGDTGGVEYYKNEDIEDAGGMSKGTKTALIVGGVLVGLAIIGFVIYKYKKGKK